MSSTTPGERFSPLAAIVLVSMDQVCPYATVRPSERNRSFEDQDLISTH